MSATPFYRHSEHILEAIYFIADINKKRFKKSTLSYPTQEKNSNNYQKVRNEKGKEWF